MAEVFLALQEGLGGFEKLVVVKRIFPHFCEDEQFVRMFIDEARLAASLSHPNVVHIQDIRRDADGFFIVMEYLSGETLAFLFEQLEERAQPIPVNIVCRVGADVAAGLHHAHSATDDHGEAAPIIHRDVTPSNIIVCFNGVTKLVDFGVAKAERRTEDSRPGTLKGKLAYLSPEQVEDRPVDPRTDVFQLGVVLHEMLTGKRLFCGSGDHAIMKAILEQPIPAPSELNERVPAALDRVVLGALERDLDRRTGSADELRRQLERVVGELGATASQHDVADWMRSSFASREKKRLKIERESVAQMRSGRPSSEMPAITAAFEDTAPVGGRSGERTEPSVVTILERPAHRTSDVEATPVRRRSRAWIAVVAAGVMTAAVVLWLRPTQGARGASEPRPPIAAAPPDAGVTADRVLPVRAAVPPDAGPTHFAVQVVTVPAGARIELDGREVGLGAWTAELPLDGRSHRLRVSAADHESQTILFRDAPPPETIELAPVARPALPRPPQRAPRDAGAATSAPAQVPDARPLPARPKTDNLDPWSR
jgi:eukaryotic-like serine/threonine-protein kinase